MKTPILLAVWVVVLAQNALAANWAQVSGSTRHSNTAVLATSPWTRRHGHAVTALDFSDAYVASTGRKARLFLIGGDSNVQGSQDLRAYPGGGSFKNDVWSTTGITWKVESSLLKQNKWGDALPQLVANLTWLQTNSGKTPPRGVTYDEWIACAAAAWAVNPPSGCDDPSAPPGAYLADSMFSPRRNFAVISFQNELMVLGGRAREHIPVPEIEMRAGVTAGELTNIRTSVGPRNARWREYAVLKNDIWRSSDAGASWTLVNVGCKFPQRALVHKAGREEFQCESSDDCEGDASCVFDETYSIGYCACNVWSPREYHAVAVHNEKIFVSGGYAMVERGNCGVEEHARKRPVGEEFACGGGLREYLNDVWFSSDGETWKQLASTSSSPFVSRGEHAMVSFRSLLYILGGRTSAADTDTGPDGTSKLLNDVWSSADGKTWSLVTRSAPWSPRAKLVALVSPSASSSTSSSTTDTDDPGELLVIFGESEERPLEDVWAWKWSSDSSEWVQDFGQGTETQGYVTPDSSVRMLRIVTSENADALERAGISTIRDLSSLAYDQLVPIRYLPPSSVALPLPSVDSILDSILATSLTTKGMPVCDYMALAKLVVEQCTVAADLDQAALLALAETAATAADATEDVTWDGCEHYGDQATSATTGRKYWPDVNGIDQVQILRDVFVDAQETICRWQPSFRSGHAGAVFKGRVFVLGGLITAPDYFDNDLWYRDPVLPLSQFTLVPRDGSSDTEFKFTSDEIGCVFEYEVLDTIEMLVVRNWTRIALATTSSSTTISTTESEGYLDTSSWLDGGTFRIRIRAVDPAGNVDRSFESGRNEYEWTYVPPLPWGLIIGGSVVAVVLIAGFLMEWRKRRKRAAMERYAMKRMRRKLRNKQLPVDTDGKKSKKKAGAKKKKDDKDGKWREAYDHAKDKKPKKSGQKAGKAADGDEKKKKKSSKDKKKDDAGRKASKANKDKDKDKSKKKKKDAKADAKVKPEKPKSKKDKKKDDKRKDEKKAKKKTK